MGGIQSPAGHLHLLKILLDVLLVCAMVCIESPLYTLKVK